MSVAWGVVVVALSGLAWGGQLVTWLSPATAIRWKLSEAEDDVEPTFWADVRGEAIWDTATLWSMPVSGVLLLADHRWWPYFGLVGGGIYLYFGGRGILTRMTMVKRGLRIGSAENVRLGYAFSAIWAAMAVVTVVAAVAALEA